MTVNKKKSNSTAAHSKNEIWDLDSGKWQQEESGNGFKLIETKTGQKISSQLTNADLQSILNSPINPSKPSWLYPPEFGFCSETGEQLSVAETASFNSWVPPIGVNSLPNRKAGIVRGLNQTDFSLKIANLSTHKKLDTPEFKISLPPNGDYQIFSIKANSADNVLVALDPKSGALFAYLPDQKEWHILEHKNHSLLSSTQVDLAAWRCESQSVNDTTELFLPTEHGLALLKLDVLSMSFDVEYYGESQCIASPIFYLDSIRQPIINEAGEIELLSYSLNSKTTEKMVLPNSQNLKLTKIQAPISTNKIVVWLCQQGQLILERKVEGLELKFLAWQPHVHPIFTMGCAYLASDGALYQLCTDESQDKNLYVEINNDFFGSYPSETRRLCSGSYNFHGSNKYKTEPWLSQEIDTNSATQSEVVRVVMPLIESLSTGNVMGLRFELTGDRSVAALVESRERERCDLVLDSANSEIVLIGFVVSEPWRLKIFIHHSAIWIYHPARKDIVGWSLDI